MDLSSISQMLRDDLTTGNLMGTTRAGLGRSLAGFMNQSPAASSGRADRGPAFDDFLELVALAQSQAELKAAAAPEDGAVSREMARNIEQMRNFSRLSGAGGLDEVFSADPTAKIRRANLEALVKSGRFGNLSGVQRGSRFLIKPARALEAEALEKDFKGRRAVDIMAPEEQDQYGLFSPLRGGASAAVEGGLGPDEYWRSDPLNSLAQTGTDWAEKGGPPMPAGRAATSENTSQAESAKARPQDGASGRGLKLEDLDRLIEKVSLALDIDPSLVKAVIKTESNFNHQAVSRAGAKGLMQLMPGTARDLGVKDPFNPVENVWAGARYLKKMLDRHNGDLNNALASYNWGPGNFDRKGKSNMPGETRRYITTVNRHYAKFKKDSASRA